MNFNKYKIRMWLSINSQKIVWFIIGWLVTSGIRDLMMGNYFSAIVSFAFAFFNYIMSN